MPNSLINTSQSIIFFLFFFFLGVCVREEGGKEYLAQIKKKKKRNPFSRMTFSLFSAHKQNKAAESQVPKGRFLWLRHAAAAAWTYSLLSSKLHQGAPADHHLQAWERAPVRALEER